jgi:hypothetical protein
MKPKAYYPTCKRQPLFLTLHLMKPIHTTPIHYSTALKPTSRFFMFPHQIPSRHESWILHVTCHWEHRKWACCDTWRLGAGNTWCAVAHGEPVYNKPGTINACFVAALCAVDCATSWQQNITCAVVTPPVCLHASMCNALYIFCCAFWMLGIRRINNTGNVRIT